MDIKKETQKKKKRSEELEAELQKPEVLQNPRRLRELTQEYNELGRILDLAARFSECEEKITASKKLISATEDPELKVLAQEEAAALEAERNNLAAEIEEALTPSDPMDKKDIIMEIRAGTGGEEAALFAGDLFRMYARYAERKGWKTHLISQNQTDLGGFKEIIFEISGSNVYRHLKYEAGVHRVQRIPTTEKSGRIHTSTITVAVLPEAEEVDIALAPKDLKIETSTARGHGGQSVNTTYSAVRVTHLPTGLVVSCQDERSQQQNRARALQILRSRILSMEEERRRRERSESRKAMVGTGERAEKIRTYNFPQDRVTDHRVNESWHNLNGVLDGNLDPLVAKLSEFEYNDSNTAS